MGLNRILKTRLAGKDHAVLTLEAAAAQGYRRLPCATCPWRRDAVGIFPAEAFRHSACTGWDAGLMPWLKGDQADLMEKAFHLFACHTAGKDHPATCAGYILKGDRAIGWKVALMRGRFDPAKVRDGGIPLFENYREMAEANGVSPADPELMACPRS